MNSKDLNRSIKVVFYDGECGLCNRTIQFILENQKTTNLKFCTLQSDFAQDFFLQKTGKLPHFDSFYFLKNNNLYKKSTGILQLIPELKIKYRFLLFGYIIPQFFRDKLYDLIAKNRKKFGITSCIMPSSKNQQQFICKTNKGLIV